MRTVGFIWVPLGRSCSVGAPLTPRPHRVSPLDLSFQVRLGGSFWATMLLKYLTGALQRLPAVHKVQVSARLSVAHL